MYGQGQCQKISSSSYTDFKILGGRSKLIRDAFESPKEESRKNCVSMTSHFESASGIDKRINTVGGMPILFSNSDLTSTSSISCDAKGTNFRASNQGELRCKNLSQFRGEGGTLLVDSKPTVKQWSGINCSPSSTSDLFRRINARYMSWKLDPFSTGRDAFQVSWTHFKYMPSRLFH